MKLEDYFPQQRVEGEVIASFGDAKLINLLNGKLELRGGSDVDRAEAWEWMSMFMPGKEAPTASSQAVA